MKNVLVASHPRSGTHLLIDVLRRQFASTEISRRLGRPLDHLYVNVERTTSQIRPFNETQVRKIIEGAQRTIFKTHYLPDYSSTWSKSETSDLPEYLFQYIDDAIVIYIHRDPRDVMVSYKQFLSGISAEVSSMTIGEFIRSEHWSAECTKIMWWAKHVEAWTRETGVNVIRYEDLIKSPEAVLLRLSELLGERPHYKYPILPNKNTSILKARMTRFFSFKPSSTAIVADGKKYTHCNWKEDLSEEDHNYLNQCVSRLVD